MQGKTLFTVFAEKTTYCIKSAYTKEILHNANKTIINPAWSFI